MFAQALRICLVALSIFSPSLLKAQEGQVLIDETGIKAMALAETPMMKQIEASYLAQEVQLRSFREGLGLNAVADASYFESKERLFTPFVPVNTPMHNYSLGVAKATRLGATVDARAFAQQFSNSFVQHATTAGVALGLSLDLGKDLFGRVTRAREDALVAGSKRAQWQKEISERAFLQNIRKLYWAWVANQESLKLSEGLLVGAEDQVKDAQRRLRASASDSGEVARFEAQASTRRANIVSLKYQREGLVRQLKELLPTLQGKDVVLGSYDVNGTINAVLACVATIQQRKEVPLDYTLYDEMAAELRSQMENDLRAVEAHDNWDLKLKSEYKHLGKNFGFREGYDDFREEGKGAWQVGLHLSVPLGSEKSDTKEAQLLLEKRRRLAEEEDLIGKMGAYHDQIMKSVLLLREGLKDQRENAEKLGHALAVDRRKYGQARLGARELVLDQELLLQAKLGEIQTRLAVINVLLDYFTVFNQVPCAVNI